MDEKEAIIASVVAEKKINPFGAIGRRIVKALSDTIDFNRLRSAKAQTPPVIREEPESMTRAELIKSLSISGRTTKLSRSTEGS